MTFNTWTQKTSKKNTGTTRSILKLFFNEAKICLKKYEYSSSQQNTWIPLWNVKFESFNVKFTWCISRELNVSLTASLVCLISDGKKVEMIFKHLRNLFQVIFSYMIVVTVVEAFGRNLFVNFGNSVLANNNPQTYN